MRTLFTPLVAVSLLVGVMPALAQGLPSTDELIKALTPNGQTMSRGIRIVPQAGNDAPTSAAPIAIPGNAIPGNAMPPSATGGRHTTVASMRPVVHSPMAPSTVTAAPAVDLTVNFMTGSAELTPQARQVLDRLGAALTSEALAQYRFKVAGHTDTVGTKEHNHTLSAQRAAAVVAYISERFGVAPARMEAVGMGSDAPLVRTGDQIPEPRNRRVEVVNIGG